MEWWMWLAAGFVLLAVELATPSGFFVMFFGVGALITGFLAAIGVLGSPPAQWLVFTAASIVCLLLFRGKIQRRVEATGARPPVDSLVGQVAFPAEAIAPGGVGRVSLRGTTWEGRNEGDVVLAVNQRCRVTRVSGLQLGVVAE